MSYRLNSCSCKNKESKYFILHMNEKYLKFSTALEQVAEAVYFHPSWKVTVEAEDGYKVTITKQNCEKYLDDEPKRIDYHLEYLEYQVFSKEANLRNAAYASGGDFDDFWYANYEAFMGNSEQELEDYKKSLEKPEPYLPEDQSCSNYGCCACSHYDACICNWKEEF